MIASEKEPKFVVDEKDDLLNRLKGYDEKSRMIATTLLFEEYFLINHLKPASNHPAIFLRFMGSGMKDPVISCIESEYYKGPEQKNACDELILSFYGKIYRL